MVKIEKLNAAKAVFIRDDIEHPVFLHAILTDAEFKTLKVLTGSVMVSIDESEVLTISAEPQVAEVIEAVKVLDAIQLNVEDTQTTTASEEVAAPVAKKTSTAQIVKPAPRVRK